MHRSRWLVPCMVVAVLPALFGACTGQGAGEQPDVADEIETDLPSWVRSVQPRPGAMTSVTTIEVRHRLRDVRGSVRLLIDGTDVTAAARVAPGVLHFDPEQPNSPIRLRPGRHTAEAQRVTRAGFGEPTRVVDTFRWSFTVL